MGIVPNMERSGRKTKAEEKRGRVMTDEPKPEIKKIGIYDIVEEYPNCTVQILRNSVTGEETFGWYDNDDPPVTVD